jgi:hypothetical protein
LIIDPHESSGSEGLMTPMAPAWSMSAGTSATRGISTAEKYRNVEPVQDVVTGRLFVNHAP